MWQTHEKELNLASKSNDSSRHTEILFRLDFTRLLKWSIPVLAISKLTTMEKTNSRDCYPMVDLNLTFELMESLNFDLGLDYQDQI